MATRVVKRRNPKFKVQETKTGSTGLCGWCLTRTHEECLGMRSRSFTCTCVICYGSTSTTKKEKDSAN